ncbi:carcinine hydrolase/isopenicillin-N N-acyltransferase family protein [Nocardiopsis sp. RSe5-2]|uniref:Carcinine hydrolase/isopenicillin-N N-acyltransferase family protein n=1 Tax=Nocardiopsis endophytica TaxID=3018445 RepID=A0ABT4U3T5_9ACTN|nr:C45 family peptidase [Nocardiopsis endophytica]MDA2811622.1 carcinine hydrolase/isopenicillin-N N-acyltransferase family protein [Nocardiopsis endophytica]
MNTPDVVAGGPDDFMTVRHLTVSGGQAEIGRALAEEARRSYGWRPRPADPVVARARRAWFERNWPQHAARTAAVAGMLGADPDAVLLDGLARMPEGSACSALWCPPDMSSDGRGRLGRNYDFFTLAQSEVFAMMASGETWSAPPSAPSPLSAPSDEPAWCSRPFIVTTLPDEGLASVVLTMDTLDGCTEGVNEAGLSVALLIADAGSAEVPDPRPQAGLDPLRLPRFVLENAADTEEAKQALLGAKQYDGGTPMHYVIADAAGNGFVWERGRDGMEHIIETDGAVCATNHFLHRNSDARALPEDGAETMGTYRRYATLAKRAADGAMSPADLEDTLQDVAFDARTAEAYPVRTLWRTVLDPGARSMSVRFYLGDAPDGALRLSEEAVFSASR